MGKALLIIVLGFSTIFGTMTLGLNRDRLEAVRSYGNYFNYSQARNCATSGIYMALSKLYQNDTWRTGYTNKNLALGTFNVSLQDHTVDPTLSSMELRVVSNATYEDVTKTITVLLGLPPRLADLAVFCTDTIINVTVYDESRNPAPSLVIQNAPDMLPFDKAGLVALAVSQSHVQNGDFTPANGYPNNSFYYDAPNDIPNVTHVLGNFTLSGGRTVYGIFVVEGNAILDGNARLEGVLYLPNPGSIVIHGGGDPKESTITGGIFANGYISGTGSHISVEYKREYMEIFGDFQLAQNMFIISWQESPSI